MMYLKKKSIYMKLKQLQITYLLFSTVLFSLVKIYNLDRKYMTKAFVY